MAVFDGATLAQRSIDSAGIVIDSYDTTRRVSTLMMWRSASPNSKSRTKAESNCSPKPRQDRVQPSATALRGELLRRF